MIIQLFLSVIYEYFNKIIKNDNFISYGGKSNKLLISPIIPSFTFSIPHILHISDATDAIMTSNRKSIKTSNELTTKIQKEYEYQTIIFHKNMSEMQRKYQKLQNEQIELIQKFKTENSPLETVKPSFIDIHNKYKIIEEIKKQKEEMGRQIKELEDKIRQKEEDILNLKKQEEENIKKIDPLLQQQLIQLEEDIKITTERYATIIQQLTDNNDKLEKVNTDLERDKKQLTTNNKRLTTANTALEREKAALEQRNTDLTREKVDLEAENTALKQRNTALEREKADLEQRNTDLTRANTALEREKADLEQRNTDLTREKQKLKKANTALKQRNTALEREKAALEQRNTALEREKADLEREKADLEREKADLEAVNTALEREKADLEREKADLEADKKTITEYFDEIKNTQDDIMKTQVQIQEKQDLIDTSKQTLSNAKQTYQQQNSAILLNKITSIFSLQYQNIAQQEVQLKTEQLLATKLDDNINKIAQMFNKDIKDKYPNQEAVLDKIQKKKIEKEDLYITTITDANLTWKQNSVYYLNQSGVIAEFKDPILNDDTVIGQTSGFLGKIGFSNIKFKFDTEYSIAQLKKEPDPFITKIITPFLNVLKMDFDLIEDASLGISLENKFKLASILLDRYCMSNASDGSIFQSAVNNILKQTVYMIPEEQHAKIKFVTYLLGAFLVGPPNAYNPAVSMIANTQTADKISWLVNGGKHRTFEETAQIKEYISKLITPLASKYNNLYTIIQGIKFQ